MVESSSKVKKNLHRNHRRLHMGYDRIKPDTPFS